MLTNRQEDAAWLLRDQGADRYRVNAYVKAATQSGLKSDAPSVMELLDVDREYRARSAAGELQLIRPRRFNPTGEAWLPVLHTRRGPRRYTALYSNTARAHRAGKTRDWVVLYSDDGTREEQYTVITAARVCRYNVAVASSDVSARRRRRSASFATLSSSLLSPTMPRAASGAIAATTLRPGDVS